VVGDGDEGPKRAQAVHIVGIIIASRNNEVPLGLIIIAGFW
jgi:hypothetical protein